MKFFKNFQKLCSLINIFSLIFFLAFILVDFAFSQCLTDSFEGPSINPCWTVSQPAGTITLSTEQSHTGTQSIKMVQTAVSGGACVMLETLPTPVKGKVTVWFYDALPSVPSAAPSLFVINKTVTPNWGFWLGTEDWNCCWYETGTYGLGEPNIITSIPRSLGWHKLEIIIGTSEAKTFIDNIEVFSKTGNFAFNYIQLSLNGVMYHPQPTFYWDDFSINLFPPFPGIQFASKVDYGTGPGPNSVFASDLDGDGDNDLALANSSAFNTTLSVLKNNGNGSFAAKVDYGTGPTPYSVFASDLDGDGDNDLAVANVHGSPGLGSVSVLKNNGDGTFAAKVDYGTGYNGDPVFVFASDLDGDGDNDLLVVNHYFNAVSVLKNNGDGTFAATVDYGTGSGPISVFASDLDGDGDNDLAVANFFSNTVSVLKNNGDGTFAAKVDYGTGSNPYGLFAGDLDGDGDRDLAVANYSSNTVSVLKNNGNGTFAAKVDYGTGSNPQTVFTSDLDGDGDNDLAVANHDGNTVSVLSNNGDGTFAAKVDYGTGSGPASVFASDLDVDGDNDLAVANAGSNTVSILINLSQQPPTLDPIGPKNVVEGGNLSFRISATELNMDTIILSALNLPANSSFIDSGNGAGSFIFNPDTSQDGVYNIIFIASDGILADSETVQITVTSNTLTGSGVSVQPPGTSGVTVTFDSVGTAGTTTGNTSSQGPPPPDGFNLVPSDPPIYYNLQTSATYIDSLTVCFDYQQENVQNESNLHLFQYAEVAADSFDWVDVTVSIDTVSNKICGRVATLGQFVITELNTSTGSDVSVQLTDSLTITFDSVAIAGTTTVETSSGGPPPPDGFKLVPSSPPIYYDIQSTATFIDSVTICLTYPEDAVQNESKMRLYHRVETSPGVFEWQNITVSVDTALNKVCGRVVSLSLFVMAEDCLIAGDANADGKISIKDVFFLINHLFKHGPAPNPQCLGDVNADGKITLEDLIYLIKYLLTRGPAPIKSGNCCL